MEFPILVFPKYERIKRSPGAPAIPNFHKPDHDQQRDRICGQFNDLKRVIEKCDASMDLSEESFVPDRVLVFEVAGRVSNFVRAAQAAGFEWIATNYSKSESDDDFYLTRYDKKTKTASKVEGDISTTLYAMLPTLESMKKMLSLWEKWDNGNQKLDEGLAPFKDMFSQLIEIRTW